MSRANYKLLLLDPSFAGRTHVPYLEYTRDWMKAGMRPTFTVALGAGPRLFIPGHEESGYNEGIREISDFKEFCRSFYPPKKEEDDMEPVFYAGDNARSGIIDSSLVFAEKFFSTPDLGSRWDEHGFALVLTPTKMETLAEIDKVLDANPQVSKHLTQEEIKTAKKFIEWVREAYNKNTTSKILALQVIG